MYLSDKNYRVSVPSMWRRAKLFALGGSLGWSVAAAFRGSWLESAVCSMASLCLLMAIDLDDRGMP
jgi:hypothetical protein